MAHNYEVGTRAWQPDPTEGWIASEVKEKVVDGDKVQLVFLLENGETKTLETTQAELQMDNNPKLPPLMNPAMLEASEDLTNLSHLNEPAVLQAIKLRYAQKEIYTYSGIVLIATNPFARVDSLYVPQMVQVYAGKHRASQAPHLFAIAEEAFADMLRDGKNQTIVVSGESGAGKTVSAKYIMRYFATRESSDQPGKYTTSRADAISETEEQILATNPVMEAFGNAKTTRNDNSSRFGKYIEIMFDDRNNIIGAKIRTYLLERSRLVFQPLKERNYHIFYQLVAGATDQEKEDLGLTSVEDFDYLNQGGTPTIEGVDDQSEFNATRKSLSTIGVPERTQAEIFRILAALLHLGNVKITATRTDSTLSPSEPSLVRACDMLGIDVNEFAKWIVKKQLITRGEKITSNLTQQQATVVKDSVAKFIYSSLFDWLVDKINRRLASDEVLSSYQSFIGVLDIYGFEHFAKNSFEQFCINYANEKLQQEFNQHVFKLEQEEYVREKIDWTFIEFSDNQPCIDLIEAKLGILSLLDEESRLPMGSDEQFVTKLHHNFAADKQKFYKKPRFGKSAFTICHYAVDVTYESDGFIEKNRDTVPDEHMDVLRNSSNEFVKEILDTAAAVREKDSASISSKPVAAPGRRIGVAVNRKPTLGGIFKSSLIELMNTINSTDVHYIRCIKPNEAKEPWKFEGPMVLSQLRACGVLETVRISTAGYPTRWTYEEFAIRYYMLCHSSQWTSEIKEMCHAILQKALGDASHQKQDKYQLGLTKIFFRAGMLAFLENLRTSRLNECAIMIQKNLRCKYYRRRYLEARSSILTTQALIRGFLARQRAAEVRQIKAATTIQRIWRGQKERKFYNEVRGNFILFQSVAKGFLCRRNIMDTIHGNAAKIIQRAFRSWRQIRAWQQYRRKVIIVQNLWRGKQARTQYKKLREEARDLKQISYKLENKVVELTQYLESLKRENKSLNSQLENYETQLKSWRSRHNALENRTRELQAEANQAGITAARLAAMEDEMSKLQQNYAEAQTIVKRLQEEEKVSRESIRSANLELDRLRQLNSEAENDRASLRQQVAELEEQLELAKRSIPLNGLNGDAQNSGSMQPPAGGLINLVSSKKSKPKRRSAGAEKIDTDRFSGAYNPRPVSMAIPSSTFGRQNFSGHTFSPGLDTVEVELENLLSEEDELNEEVTMGLIRNLKIPLPSSTPPPTEKEVLFPAYLINLVTSEMWNNGFVKESERFLANVMQSIQQEVMQHDGDDAINPGAFWLSNVHEMLSFVFLAEDWYEAQKTDNYEYDRLLEIVKHDLESLEFNIYHTWMKVLKKKLYKMIVPAIIESQSLPGFVTSETNRFLGKLLPSNNNPAYSMDNLLSLLNNVYKAMKAFYLEDSIVIQTVTELLRLVGVTAFNDLLMRRNFLSWKRGLQINYNITRIEEWCKSHDMPEGTLQLEHLMQATKLLQLKKATLNDIEIIQDICWMLSPNQIQKLLNQYLVADYEQPINGEIMKAVASRVTEKSDVLLLTPVDMEDSGPYEIAEPRVITALETYTPSWLQTPRLKRLAEIVSAQAMAQQERLEISDTAGMPSD
ncbi:class V myosin (Myo4), putative [Aspergillus udagawae]|uniref:Class V myosin (Myo4), putative n=1 Tax=Aspergillus udagawae TaxID=91492 RepID=A0A8H3SHT3_9EURO|nr:myosin type-2 heavy chain 1 [Aspergillus udagawae]GFF28306.1 class V myosin (Myo4), putative [Aspergillus udagawae]GFF57762.1 class V myosin (Myo4), putative [Aspergillus udagawae]GFF60625.1 class V myosin (Myo4), putative [Aspergillus udagawae]GFF99163.1 class V myosin (Myo4), putative [Aspergillus udagawae]GFG11911.1 class V myosin (Myo4), putative [Aspergillus udagawae]